MTPRLPFVFASIAASFLVAACSSSTSEPGECSPSDPQCSVHADGGGAGTDAGSSSQDSSVPQEDAGDMSDAGNHEGGHVPDGGPADVGPVDAPPGSLPFGDSCTDNSQCASGDCFNFNAKGMHCTMPCQTANDCPGGAGGLGCSGMGQCKI